MVFDETMSGGEGFSFDYATANVSSTPLPVSWTMMLTGLGTMGAFGCRRKRKDTAAMAAA
jgi:hypothetical protein